MLLEKRYKIKKWSAWNDIISDATVDFFEEFNFYPNILLANKYTFSQFNFIVQIDSLHEHKLYEEDEITGEKHYNYESGTDPSMRGFSTSNCELAFCYDLEFPDKEFALFYDDDPDFGDNDETPLDDLSGKLVFA